MLKSMTILFSMLVSLSSWGQSKREFPLNQQIPDETLLSQAEKLVANQPFRHCRIENLKIENKKLTLTFAGEPLTVDFTNTAMSVRRPDDPNLKIKILEPLILGYALYFSGGWSTHQAHFVSLGLDRNAQTVGLIEIEKYSAETSFAIEGKISRSRAPVSSYKCWAKVN